MSQQIDPDLQEALRDEIDSLRALLTLKPGIHCALIVVVVDNSGNLHFQFTGTKDHRAAASLAVGMNYAAAEFIKGLDFPDAD